MSGGGDRDSGRLSGMGLPSRPPKPGTAMSVFVLLVGIAIVSVGAYSYVSDSAALADRAQVTAEVTDVGVKEVEASRGRDAYVPVATFQYEYQGTSYTSDRLYPGRSQPQYEDKMIAQERLSEYAAGQSVTAYVDPEAPGQAFLEDSRSGLPTGAFLVGVIVSLVGGVGLYQARAEARARDLLS